jgi:G:T-mismatch repair DNA endonuclease (very short patch repair protein)
MTKPEKVTENILKSLGIIHIYQHFDKYYWVDFYLPEFNLLIEVQGDYFHCHPLKNFNYNVLNKGKILTKDKRKHSYFKNKDIKVLYLWEDDLINNKNKCENMIIEYIKNDGILKNYHSFNFDFNTDVLSVNEKLVVIGY